MSDPIRTAFLGAGMVAEVHQQAIQQLTEIELVAIHDPDLDLLERRAGQWGVKACTTVEEILDDPNIDAVHVLAPSELHADLATRAMAADKHALVEKPVSSIAGIQDLLTTSRQHERVCMPGHNYAYQPEFARIHGLVRSPEQPLGDVRAAWITYAIQHPEEIASRYSGVLDEVMVHHSYLAVALFGEPDWLLAGKDGSGWQHHDQEDQAWMTWRYSSRRSVHLFASFAVDDPTSSSSMFTVKVLGTNGAASYQWSDAVFQRALGSLTFGIPAYEETYIHENRAFAAACRGDRDRVISPLEDALVVARLSAEAQHSASTGTAWTPETAR